MVADAKERKRAKYHNLVEAGRAVGYKTELLKVEIGSRGMLGVSDFDAMKKAINALRKTTMTCAFKPSELQSSDRSTSRAPETITDRLSWSPSLHIYLALPVYILAVHCIYVYYSEPR